MIYLDYVATTPLNKEIYKTYIGLLDKYFANADSSYSLGYEVNGLMEKSRSLIADMLGVKSEELIFTSCASEANNTAIKGVAFQNMHRGYDELRENDWNSLHFQALAHAARAAATLRHRSR